MESNNIDEEFKDKHDYSVKHFAREALHDFTHFDTKFLKTIKPLLLKPGYLTVKAFSAEQSAYVKPLALFVFLNFIFFVFKVKGLFNYTLEGYQSENMFTHVISSVQNKTHLSYALFAERFNTAMQFEEKEYLVILVPLFALFIHLLYFNKKKTYIEHLFFSLHFFSFFLLFLTVSPVVFSLILFLINVLHISPTWFYTEPGVLSILFPVFFFYMLFAMRFMYRQNWLISVIKSAISTAGVFALIAFVYRTILFFIVIHSITE